MKKLILMTLAIGMLAGCKKGPNDPGISWRSRDGRLIAEWTMESSEENQANKNGSTTQETNTKYDGSKYTSVIKTNGSSGTPNTDPTSYKGTLTIDKDGSCKFVQVATPQTGPSTTTTHVGKWAWLNSKKNKSVIQIEDITTNMFDAGIYNVDELRHKKLVLKHSSSTETASTNTVSKKSDYTYTFKQ